MQWVTQRFLLHTDYSFGDAALGLETQSAVLGDYGGFYVFGFYGMRSIPVTKHLQLQSGFTAATGGGASAPDGDGFMYRAALGGSYSINNRVHLGLSANHLNFPSGDIRSNHLAFELHYTMPYAWEPSSHVSLYPGSFTIIGGLFSFDSRDAGRISDQGYSAYNGIRVSQSISRHLELDLQLGASAIGSTDGFMDYKAGLSWIPFEEASISPLFRGQLGSGGGGSVHTGGGISYVAGAGIRVLDRIELTINYWDALQTDMAAPLVEVGYRVPFTTNAAFIAANEIGAENRSALKNRSLFLVAGNRTQFSRGLDRNDQTYEPMTSLFMGLKLPITGKLQAAGETLWAASGGYGAYAEGMFGLYHDTWSIGNTHVGWNGSVVVAGGGGIEVGSGAALSGGLHISHPLTKVVRSSWVMRYKYFGLGAYNPVVIGVQLEPRIPIWAK